MKNKINFKSGFVFGGILGIIIITIGYFTIQNVLDKAENISNFNLHELNYQDMEGNDISLSEYQGSYVLVNFWATWCGPCVKEFPVLNEVYSELKDDVVFVMVSYESIEKIQNFKENNLYNFIFLKSNNFMLEGITSVPQTFILDKKGGNIQHHPTIFEGSKESVLDLIKSWIE